MITAGGKGTAVGMPDVDPAAREVIRLLDGVSQRGLICPGGRSPRPPRGVTAFGGD